MTTQNQDPTNLFQNLFSNLQGSTQFFTKVVNTMVEESDKQVAEGVKWMNTLNEHAVANRNTAMKMWMEGVERSAAMTQAVMNQATAAFRVQK